MVTTFTPQPLPPHIPPPPAGWVYIGRGHAENENANFRIPARMWRSIRAEWALDNRAISNHIQHYAIEANSPHLVITDTPVAPDRILPDHPNATQPTRDAFHALPEHVKRILNALFTRRQAGFAVMPNPAFVPIGEGNIAGDGQTVGQVFAHFQWPTRSAAGVWYDEHERRWNNDPTYNGAAVYAVWANHPILAWIEMAGQIFHGAPTAETASAQTARNPITWSHLIPPIGNDLPPVQPGWVYIGQPARFVHCLPLDEVVRTGNPGASRWGNTRPVAEVVLGAARHMLIQEGGRAYHRIFSHDDWRFPDQHNIAEGLPPLPNDHILLGEGGSFPSPMLMVGASSVACRYAFVGSAYWSGVNEHGTTRTAWFAIERNSAYAIALMEKYGDPYAPPEAEPELVVTSPRKWTVLMNGVPVATRDELITMVRNIELQPDNAPAFAAAVWTAIYENENPNRAMMSLIDDFPVASAVIDFEQTADHASNEVIKFAQSERPLSEMIATIAAGAMLRGGMHDHFVYNESGLLVINGENPPTLEDGYEMIRRSLDMKRTAAGLDSQSGWYLGMLAHQLGEFFGDAFHLDEVLAQTGKAYNTVVQAINVFRACWVTRERYPGLTFTHFKEVHYSSLEDDDKEFVLHESHRLGLSAFEQRKLKSYVRIYGREGLEEQPLEDIEDLIRRTETRAVSKRYLFFLRSENRWYEYKGPFEHIPNGAGPILNADTRAIVNQTGDEIPVRTWTRPGEELPRGHAIARVLEAEASETIDGPPPPPHIESTQPVTP